MIKKIISLLIAPSLLTAFCLGCPICTPPQPRAICPIITDLKEYQYGYSLNIDGLNARWEIKFNNGFIQSTFNSDHIELFKRELETNPTLINDLKELIVPFLSDIYFNSPKALKISPLVGEAMKRFIILHLLLIKSYLEEDLTLACIIEDGTIISWIDQSILFLQQNLPDQKEISSKALSYLLSGMHFSTGNKALERIRTAIINAVIQSGISDEDIATIDEFQRSLNDFDNNNFELLDDAAREKNKKSFLSLISRIQDRFVLPETKELVQNVFSRISCLE